MRCSAELGACRSPRTICQTHAMQLWHSISRSGEIRWPREPGWPWKSMDVHGITPYGLKRRWILMHEKDRVHRFLEGLRPEVRIHVELKNPTTLSDAVEWAIQADSLVWQIKRRRSSPTPGAFHHPFQQQRQEPIRKPSHHHSDTIAHLFGGRYQIGKKYGDGTFLHQNDGYHSGTKMVMVLHCTIKVEPSVWYLDGDGNCWHHYDGTT